MDDGAVVLDGLIKIREDVDGTLALRCSCRSAICGSCAMRINGQPCSPATRSSPTWPQNGAPVVVEPAGNMQVIKDLVVDFEPFWDKVRAVGPWLQVEGPPPGPDEEYVAPNDDMLHLSGVMACIMCGACVSDCTVLEVDENFLGPAALAKAYRFVADPRDEADEAGLATWSSTAAWDCTRCMQCVEVCPKGVDPMGRIMAMRDRAMEAGHTGSYGARHTTVFTEMVEHSGRVDELRLPLKTKGMFNVPEMLKLVPVGLRAQIKGKRPPIIHGKNPGQDNVRRIFDKVEDR